MNTKLGFTMIELVFVIVVLGILSAIAIPKFAATRDDAIFVKGKSQVSAIRSGIVMQKSKRLLEGNTTGGYYPPTLEKTASGNLFDNGILEYGLTAGSKDGDWNRTTTYDANGTATAKYQFKVMGKTIKFEYTKANGQFACDGTQAASELKTCNDLTK